jgi:hypothetical protein
MLSLSAKRPCPHRSSSRPTDSSVCLTHRARASNIPFEKRELRRGDRSSRLPFPGYVESCSSPLCLYGRTVHQAPHSHDGPGVDCRYTASGSGSSWRFHGPRPGRIRMPRARRMAGGHHCAQSAAPTPHGIEASGQPRHSGTVSGRCSLTGG